MYLTEVVEKPNMFYVIENVLNCSAFVLRLKRM